MTTPKIISDWLSAMGRYDSHAYADCFSETAVVHDEGKTFTGKEAIRQFNEETIKKYKMTISPIDTIVSGATCVLTAKISGTFDGSPIVFKFQFELRDDKIQTLTVTGL